MPVLPSPPRKQWHRHHDPAALESPIPYVVVIFHHIDRKTNNHSNNIQTICDIHRHHPQHGLVVLTCSSYHVLQVNPRSHHLATKHRHICCFLHLGIVLHDDGSAGTPLSRSLVAPLFVFVCFCLFVVCLYLYYIYGLPPVPPTPKAER